MTVQGEIRELCAYRVKGLGLGNTPAETFIPCIPNQLKQQGYPTLALHGGSKIMYNRPDWYPKAGFDEIKAQEEMPDKKRCASFDGVCE